MSQTLSKWNMAIFLGQVFLLVVVTGMTLIAHASAQEAVIIGLGSVIVFTALNAAGAMKQERWIVYDLSIGNACGLVSVFFLVLAGINYGSVPTNVATTCFVGGVLFLWASVAMAVSAARIAATLKAREPMRTLILMAAPLGIGPIADMVIRRRLAQTAKQA